MAVRNPDHTQVPATLAAELLHARTPEQVARILIANAPALATAGCRLWWSVHWPDTPRHHPAGKTGADEIALARRALSSVRDGGPAPPGFVVLSDDGDA